MILHYFFSPSVVTHGWKPSHEGLLYGCDSLPNIDIINKIFPQRIINWRWEWVDLWMHKNKNVESTLFIWKTLKRNEPVIVAGFPFLFIINNWTKKTKTKKHCALMLFSFNYEKGQMALRLPILCTSTKAWEQARSLRKEHALALIGEENETWENSTAKCQMALIRGASHSLLICCAQVSVCWCAQVSCSVGDDKDL